MMDGKTHDETDAFIRARDELIAYNESIFAAGRQAGLREAAEVARKAGESWILPPGNPHQMKGTFAQGAFEAAKAAVSAITALIEPSPCPPPPASS